MADTITLFLVEAPCPEWRTDYSDILIHGMAEHLERENGLIQLERTASFVPPVTFPGIYAIIILHEIKEAFERSGLQGIAFRPVLKTRIVELHWETWDLTAEALPEYPEGGEPKNFILHRPHSSVMAEQIGTLWELYAEQVVQSLSEAQDLIATGPVIDCLLIWKVGVGVSARMRTFLHRQAGEWVQFRPIHFA